MAKVRGSARRFLRREYGFEEHTKHSMIGDVNGFTVIVTAPANKTGFNIRVGGIGPRGSLYEQRQKFQKLLDKNKFIRYIVRYEYCFEVIADSHISLRSISRTIQNSIEEITSFMKEESFEDVAVNENCGKQIFYVEKEIYSTENLTEKKFFDYIQSKNLSSAPIDRSKKWKGYAGAFIGSLIGILFWGYFAKLDLEKLLILSCFPGYALVKCTFDGFARMTRGEMDRHDVIILTSASLFMNLAGAFFVGAIMLQDSLWESKKEYISLTQSYGLFLAQFIQSPLSFGVLLVNYAIASLITLLFGKNIYKEARIVAKS